MNKLLPILLVAVLSGCSSGPKEYSCSLIGEEDYGTYVKITNSEIIIDGDKGITNHRGNSDTYKIISETSHIITASRISYIGFKNVAEFDNRLLRLHLFATYDTWRIDKTNGVESTIYTMKCKKL